MTIVNVLSTNQYELADCRIYTFVMIITTKKSKFEG
jgi:hypothetical protein